MMYDREKSDPAIVAAKPTNKAGQPSAELVEPRAGAKGNVHQQSTGRALYRETVSQALTRMRHVARILRSAVTHPRWEKLWGGGGGRGTFIVHTNEPMEVAPWPKSMISAEA
jgi:hypothetical protein